MQPGMSTIPDLNMFAGTSGLFSVSILFIDLSVEIPDIFFHLC